MNLAEAVQHEQTEAHKTELKNMMDSSNAVTNSATDDTDNWIPYRVFVKKKKQNKLSFLPRLLSLNQRKQLNFNFVWK